MLIKATTLTPALSRWLRETSDDDAHLLRVVQVGVDIDVSRWDGSELSEPERRRVLGIMAANDVEPLK